MCVCAYRWGHSMFSDRIKIMDIWISNGARQQAIIFGIHKKKHSHSHISDEMVFSLKKKNHEISKDV